MITSSVFGAQVCSMVRRSRGQLRKKPVQASQQDGNSRVVASAARQPLAELTAPQIAARSGQAASQAAAADRAVLAAVMTHEAVRPADPSPPDPSPLSDPEVQQLIQRAEQLQEQLCNGPTPAHPFNLPRRLVSWS